MRREVRMRVSDLMSQFRIGQGFDVHALVAGRKLIIGGVHIPYEKGLDGHSDAVKCHGVRSAAA